MPKKPIHAGVLCALLFASTSATGQIEALSLEQMVQRADNAVSGEIVKREVIRIDHPIDGPELYFTHLTIEGQSLLKGRSGQHVVTYPGGFIDEEHGVWNSVAPTLEETQVGSRVVAFFAHSENMGGELSGNALYAARGGLYRQVKGRKGEVVLGRGKGFAIENNIKLNALNQRVESLGKVKQRGGQDR